jgi:hypothetical protein
MQIFGKPEATKLAPLLEAHGNKVAHTVSFLLYPDISQNIYYPRNVYPLEKETAPNNNITL